MSGRWGLWVVTGLCGLTALGLAAVTVLVDLDTGDKVASIVGAVAGLIGCMISIYFGTRQAQQNGAIQARGRGAVAAGRNITGNAIGKNSKVTSASQNAASIPRLAAPSPQVSAHGRGAVSGGHDVTGNAIGEGSEVEEK
jgi:hypothetical protein